MGTDPNPSRDDLKQQDSSVQSHRSRNFAFVADSMRFIKEMFSRYRVAVHLVIALIGFVLILFASEIAEYFDNTSLENTVTAVGSSLLATAIYVLVARDWLQLDAWEEKVREYQKASMNIEIYEQELKSITDQIKDSTKKLSDSISGNAEEYNQQMVDISTQIKGDISNSISALDLAISEAPDKLTNIYPYNERDKLYDAAIATLKSKKWYQVSIYSPVGVWEDNQKKKDWLEAVAKEARKGNVANVEGIFGLMPLTNNRGRKSDEEFQMELERAKEALAPFKEIDNVTLRWTKPSSSSIGFGIIIFQGVRGNLDGIIAFGFATKGKNDYVDGGFGMSYHPEVFPLVTDWFSKRLEISSQSQPLQHNGRQNWQSVDDFYDVERRSADRGFNAIYVKTHDNVVSQINRIQQRDLHDKLRLMIYGNPKSPDEITNELMQLMEDRENLIEELLLFVDPDTVDLEFLNEVQERLNRYGDLINRVKAHVCHMSPPEGIDTYIIEDKHVIFNFSYPAEGIKKYYKAIILEDVPEMAREYIDFFERNRRNAITLDKEIKRVQNRDQS